MRSFRVFYPEKPNNDLFEIYKGILAIKDEDLPAPQYNYWGISFIASDDFTGDWFVVSDGIHTPPEDIKVKFSTSGKTHEAFFLSDKPISHTIENCEDHKISYTSKYASNYLSGDISEEIEMLLNKPYYFRFIAHSSGSKSDAYVGFKTEKDANYWFETVTLLLSNDD